MHWGIDIAAPMGTPVVASAAGVVTSAGVARGHGKFVVIAHGGGWVTVYSHLSVIGVATGARVAQGQWIGWVGRTGVATGPHLHFEVWHRGSPVDPLWALGLRP
jgi:murein DD-endopeptidase MepM/ murein hydrolase activator NlpD